eukprot:m51a1_g6439 putative domain containing protein (1173) ;mRNA; r:373324-377487
MLGRDTDGSGNGRAMSETPRPADSDVREWMCTIFADRGGSAVVDALWPPGVPVDDVCRSGALLCAVANALCPGCCPARPYVGPVAYLQLANSDCYIRAAGSVLGLHAPPPFTASDVYEGRARIAAHLRALGSVHQKTARRTLLTAHGSTARSRSLLSLSNAGEAAVLAEEEAENSRPPSTELEAELVSWANSHMPEGSQSRFCNLGPDVRTGVKLLRLAEGIGAGFWAPCATGDGERLALWQRTQNATRFVQWVAQNSPSSGTRVEDVCTPADITRGNAAAVVKLLRVLRESCDVEYSYQAALRDDDKSTGSSLSPPSPAGMSPTLLAPTASSGLVAAFSLAPPSGRSSKSPHKEKTLAFEEVDLQPSQHRPLESDADIIAAVAAMGSPVSPVSAASSCSSTPSVVADAPSAGSFQVTSPASREASGDHRESEASEVAVVPKADVTAAISELLGDTAEGACASALTKEHKKSKSRSTRGASLSKHKHSKSTRDKDDKAKEPREPPEPQAANADRDKPPPPSEAKSSKDKHSSKPHKRGKSAAAPPEAREARGAPLYVAATATATSLPAAVGAKPQASESAALTQACPRGETMHASLMWDRMQFERHKRPDSSNSSAAAALLKPLDLDELKKKYREAQRAKAAQNAKSYVVTEEQRSRWPGIEVVLADPVLRADFRSFTTTEIADENLEFLEATEVWERLRESPGGREMSVALASKIMLAFFSDESAQALNVSHDVRAALEAAVREGRLTPSMWDAARTEVMRMLKLDLYPRWIAVKEAGIPLAQDPGAMVSPQPLSPNGELPQPSRFLYARPPSPTVGESLAGLKKQGDKSPSRARVRRAKMRVRERLVKQLVESEAAYVETINAVVSCVADPLAHTKAVPESTLFSVFSNLPLLLAQHRNLLGKLQALLESWTPESTVGDVFLASTQFFLMYSVYARNFPKSLVLLRVMKRDFALQFSLCMKLLQSSPSFSASFTVESVLELPMKRLERYASLLKDLHDYTPPEHADFEYTRRAVDWAEGVRVGVEAGVDWQSLSAAENLLSIVDSMSESVSVDLLVPGVAFLREECFARVTVTEPRKVIEEPQVFLFSNRLLVCTCATDASSSSVPYTVEYSCGLQVKEPPRLETDEVMNLVLRLSLPAGGCDVVLAPLSDLDAKVWFKELTARCKTTAC